MERNQLRTDQFCSSLVRVIILVSSYTQCELSGYMHCLIRENEPQGRQGIKTSVRRTHPKETTISAHRVREQRNGFQQNYDAPAKNLTQQELKMKKQKPQMLPLDMRKQQIGGIYLTLAEFSPLQDDRCPLSCSSTRTAKEELSLTSRVTCHPAWGCWPRPWW